MQFVIFPYPKAHINANFYAYVLTLKVKSKFCQEDKSIIELNMNFLDLTSFVKLTCGFKEINNAKSKSFNLLFVSLAKEN